MRGKDTEKKREGEVEGEEEIERERWEGKRTAGSSCEALPLELQG